MKSRSSKLIQRNKFKRRFILKYILFTFSFVGAQPDTATDSFVRAEPDTALMPTFVPIEDEVSARVLIDDLATLAPIANKAYDVLIGDDALKLWYNRSLDAINLQPKDMFEKQKPTEKIGIRRANAGLSYFYENVSVSGIPSTFVEKLTAASETIRKAKKLYDKGTAFDPESLKLIFEYLKEEKRNSDNPFQVKLSKTEVFVLWIKRVRTAPAAVAVRGGVAAEPETKFYLNIQDEKKFDECAQENKLGLEIDEEGRVTSAVCDGKEKPPEEIEALLYDSDGLWNKRLTQILKKVLEDEGFKLDKKILRIHLLTLQKIPEVVVTKWGKLSKKPDRVNFMDDKFAPGPGIDCGGLTKQFFSDLARALFDGRAGRALRVDENGCPFVQAGDPLDDGLARAVGQFMSEVVRRDLTIGRIFPEAFFALLRALAAAPKPSDKRTLEVAALFAGEYQRPIVAWLGGDDAARDAALEMMGYAGEDGLEDLPLPAQRGRALRYLEGLSAPYVRVATAIAKGFSPALAERVRAGTPSEASALLQGNPIDADDIVSRFVIQARARARARAPPPRPEPPRSRTGPCPHRTEPSRPPARCPFSRVVPVTFCAGRPQNPPPPLSRRRPPCPSPCAHTPPLSRRMRDSPRRAAWARFDVRRVRARVRVCVCARKRACVHACLGV